MDILSLVASFGVIIEDNLLKTYMKYLYKITLQLNLS